jgi:hypothetical protein
MEQKSMPKNVQELKQIILEVVNEINNSVQEISYEEQKEIDELYGDLLYKECDEKDCLKL